LNNWVVDYQRPTISPRLVPYAVPTDVKLEAILANNVYPGPSIKCNQGDVLNVTVVNNLIDKEVALSFFGVEPQADYEGLINPQGVTKSYVLNTPKAGTFYWSATSPFQAAAGLRGTIVVANATAAKPLEERLMVLSDARRQPNLCFDSEGKWDEKDCGAIDKATLNGQWGDGSSKLPTPVVEVKEGSCYLMRFMALAPTNTMFEVSIQDHTLAPSAGEATPVSSVKVAPNAESGIDAVLCANQKPIFDKQFSISYVYSTASQKKTFSATLQYV